MSLYLRFAIASALVATTCWGNTVQADDLSYDDTPLPIVRPVAANHINLDAWNQDEADEPPAPPGAAVPDPSAPGPIASSGGCVGGCDISCGCEPQCGCEPARGCDGGCNSRCGRRRRLGSCFDKCCLGDVWELCDANPCCRTKVSGHVQIGYHTAGRNGNGTGLFNTRPNEVQLQQAWLTLEKQACNGGCGTDWGYRIDFVYGTDGPNTQAFGGQPNEWDNGWDYGRDYGSAIPQLYLDYQINDLTLRMGHFYTIVGYEVVPATGNFFYSHAFTMNLSEPFTHTGVLGIYNYTDDITVYGGYSLGWDTGFSQVGGDTFIGGLSVPLTDRVTATYIATYGDFGDNAGAGGSDADGYSHSLVFDMAVTDKFNYILQSDLVDNNRFNGRSESTIGVNQYFIYQKNECWGFGARVEWYRSGGEVTAYTAGVNYKPHANVMIRPEYRYDDYTGTVNGSSTDSGTFGADLIFTF